MGAVFICSFSSGLDDMPRKDQKDVVKVLRVLAQCKRFSVFEATDNQTIAKMMDKILHKAYGPYGKLVNTTGGAYPWTEIELTEGGKRLLEDNPA